MWDDWRVDSNERTNEDRNWLADTAEAREVDDHVSRTLTDERADSVDTRRTVLAEAWERTAFIHV